jgi:hypothetical protein
MHMIRSHSSAGIGAVAIVTMLCPIRGGALATPDTTEVYEYMLCWGEHGSGPGEFSGANGMGSDRYGNLYVCDTQNHRIQKFDSLGNLLLMFGESGQGPGQFSWARDVAVDESGSIYVVDTDLDRVQKFDSLGCYLLEFGEEGHQPGQLSAPISVAVGDTSYVYVVDNGNPWVQRFNSEGQFDTLWGPPDSMTWQEGVVTAYPGSIYVPWSRPDPREKHVYRSDPVGNTILLFGNFGNDPGEFRMLIDMSADCEGSLFLGDDWLSRVTKFDSLGNFITMWGSHGSGPGEFGILAGITADLSGNVYASDYEYDRIQKFRRVLVEVEGGAEDELSPEGSFRLGPNMPNPFAVSTLISYGVPEVAGAESLPVRLMIYNLLGQALITLVDAQQPPGSYAVTWDGCSESGDPVASGVYLYRLECGGEVVTRRCVLVR